MYLHFPLGYMYVMKRRLFDGKSMQIITVTHQFLKAPLLSLKAFSKMWWWIPFSHLLMIHTLLSVTSKHVFKISSELLACMALPRSYLQTHKRVSPVVKGLNTVCNNNHMLSTRVYCKHSCSLDHGTHCACQDMFPLISASMVLCVFDFFHWFFDLELIFSVFVYVVYFWYMFCLIY